MKQMSRRAACAGSCVKWNTGEPHRRRKVPWTTDSRNSSNDSERNAFFESVERVRGRKRMICAKLLSLWSVSANTQRENTEHVLCSAHKYTPYKPRTHARRRIANPVEAATVWCGGT